MKKNIILILAVLFSVLAYSQVGINTARPNSNAGLHVSERKDPASTGTPDKYNGVMIQRYTTTERDNITVATAENSLMIFNTTENCYNYWDAPELEWKSLCGNMGNAKFTFDCANVSLKGTYVKGKETDGSDYITITLVNVTKPGAYLITASSNPENGYSFVGQGTVTTTGTQTIRLYAQGTPVAAQTDNFIISSSGSPTQPACTVPVTVNPDISAYALNCSSTTVNGIYVKGTPLTASNTITMNVNVTTLGSYSISTPTVSGISFSASGVFTSTGTQQITLLGTGTPTVNSDISVDITANTISGNATCSAIVPITLPRMTYAIIGNSDYSWASGQRRNALSQSSNFGPGGLVDMVGFDNLWTASSAGAAVTAYNNNSQKPDIILYFAYGASPTTALSTLLNDYVNAGGVLIYGTEDNNTTQTNLLLGGIFGMPNAAQSQIGGSETADNAYPINSLQSDPIANGPFGNTAGQTWGEDNASTGSVLVTSLPPNSVQLVTAYQPTGKPTVNPGYSMVWYNNSKNFVYFGDSVATANTDTGIGSYPSLYLGATLTPTSKFYGPSNASARFVYNSTLELNAVGWAIEKAAVSGINPH